MVFVELPSEGDEASIEDEFCVVESVKAASGVYANFKR
jgi:glycine cleavage system H protein